MKLLLWSNLGLLFRGACIKFLFIRPASHLYAIAGAGAEGPLGVMFFVALVGEGVAADIAMKGRGARGESGHVGQCLRRL